MNPKTEAQSLIENPLPHELAGSAYDYGIVDKDVVLTTITYIDDELDYLRSIVDFLVDQRVDLLQRAVKEGIKSDQKATLVENVGKLYRNPISDLARFETEFPGGYRIIRKNQVYALKEKKMEIDTEIKNINKVPITLTEADEVLGKNMITAFVGTKPQTIIYDVVKKRTYPKELK
jgi:hypothetical protein